MGIGKFNASSRKNWSVRIQRLQSRIRIHRLQDTTATVGECPCLELETVQV